jgi:hypothetical protein
MIVPLVSQQESWFGASPTSDSEVLLQCQILLQNIGRKAGVSLCVQLVEYA